MDLPARGGCLDPVLNEVHQDQCHKICGAVWYGRFGLLERARKSHALLARQRFHPRSNNRIQIAEREFILLKTLLFAENTNDLIDERLHSARNHGGLLPVRRSSVTSRGIKAADKALQA